MVLCTLQDGYTSISVSLSSEQNNYMYCNGNHSFLYDLLTYIIYSMINSYLKLEFRWAGAVISTIIVFAVFISVTVVCLLGTFIYIIAGLSISIQFISVATVACVRTDAIGAALFAASSVIQTGSTQLKQ